jgi:cellulose synthase/poly-beta-1,6-N-acetylglucosamine synthase-like glycosyltransferase
LAFATREVTEVSWTIALSMVGFWVALAALVYVYVGYPIIAYLRGAVYHKPVSGVPSEPFVTVVVVAYNEAQRIERRIQNLLWLDYPHEKLEIIVASDGSEDETACRARSFERSGVRVWAFHSRRGKAAVLNDVVPSARGEIVVLADARQRFERDTIRALVADFGDASVGAVSGELVIRARATERASTIGAGASFYWQYEKFIRRHESRANSTVGATGAVYAIRRELFERIPADTLLDDVLIPMRIVSRGYRVVFEPEARAYDVPASSARQEFVRKVRTIAGTFQLFARERWLLNPFRNGVWFETLSHKGLRLLMPLLHAVILVANVGLMSMEAYRWFLAGQVAFYAAAASALFVGQRRTTLLMRVPYTMCLLVWATVVGFVYFVTRQQHVTWDRVVTSQGIRS